MSTIQFDMSCVSRLKLRIVVPLLFIFFCLAHLGGIFLCLREEDYYTKFSYPIEGNVLSYAHQLRRGETPFVTPINTHNYKFIKTSEKKCVIGEGSLYDHLRLVFIVKSSMDHFDRRQAIRRTWGFEKRFADVGIRTIFLLGSSNVPSESLDNKIMEEFDMYADIVQGDFIDTYYNNTIKTMMGLRWASHVCNNARFYFFVDDDYFVSAKNVLRFLRNPVQYPVYLQTNDATATLGLVPSQENEAFFDLPQDVHLYAGFVYANAHPLRYRSSKWFVTLNEYPYNYWPPFVTAGAYVLSRESLLDIFYASYFVKMFRFDDIYLSFIAKKIGLEPLHSLLFYTTKRNYEESNFRFVVASHGYEETQEMIRVWTLMKASGNA